MVTGNSMVAVSGVDTGSGVVARSRVDTGSGVVTCDYIND